MIVFGRFGTARVAKTIIDERHPRYTRICEAEGLTLLCRP